MDEFSEGPDTSSLNTDERPPDRTAKLDGRTMSNAERIANVMKPRGRVPGSSPRKAPKKMVSLRGELIAYLSLANLLFAFAPDQIKGDALDQAEIIALATAVDDAAMANAEMYKYLDMILRGGTGGIANLVVICLIIAGRRLARHGRIAEEWDTRLGAMAEGMADPEMMAAMMGAMVNANPTPVA